MKHRLMVRVRVAVVVVVATLVCPVVAATPAHAATCADVEFLGSRGSGQTDMWESPLKETLQAVRDAMPGKTIDPWANRYLAVPIAGDEGGWINGLGALTQTAGLGVGAYHDSVQTGTAYLTDEINRARAACPGTRLILVGFSQGAQVTGDAYQALTATQRSSVLGVVMYGDPYFNGNSNGGRGDFDPSRNGILALPATRVRPEFPDVQKVLSYCHANDPVCQGLLHVDTLRAPVTTLSFQTHLNYGTVGDAAGSVDYPHRVAAALAVALGGTVSGGGPVAAVTPVSPVAPGATFGVSAGTSYDPAGRPLSYAWNLTDPSNPAGYTTKTTGPQVSTSFPSAGSYKIGVKVSNDQGKIATATTTVQVAVPGGFTAPPTAPTSLFVTTADDHAKATLNWQPPATGPAAEAYVVFTSDGLPVYVTTSGAAGSVTLPAVDFPENVQVQAVNRAGLGGVSAPAEVSLVHDQNLANNIAGRFIAVLPESVSAAAVPGLAQGLITKYGGTISRTFPSVGSFSFTGTDAQAEQMAADPGVLFVDEDQVVEAEGTQTLAPWGLARLNLRTPVPASGRTFTSGPSLGVTVYMLDTGIRLTHEQFGNRAIYGFNAFTLGKEADDDSYDGHGTATASVVGGKDYGVAKEATLVAVKDLKADHKGDVEWTVAALEWVEDQYLPTKPSAVVNISHGFGGRGSAAYRAMNRMARSGLSVVNSGGNQDYDSCNRYDLDKPIIAVGATNISDERMAGTEYGKCLDLMAPGETITVAVNGATNTAAARLSGTSYAAAHVSGAAALLLGGNPTLSPQQIKESLLGNASTGLKNLKNSPDKLLYVAPPTQPGSGSSDANLNAMFNNYGNSNVGGNWTGGDGTVSVPLPDGRTAWFFSDTFMGTVNADHSRPAGTPMIHNSMVVQKSGAFSVDGAGTRFGGTAAAPTSLVTTPTEGQSGDMGLWVRGGIVSGGTLNVLYVHVVRGPTGGAFDVIFQDTYLATFSLPGLVLQSTTKVSLNSNITWGVASVDGNDGYTYIYGSVPENQQSYLYIARAPKGQEFPVANWQYWTGAASPGAQWSASESAAVRVMSGLDPGFGVAYLGAKHEFVLVSRDAAMPFSADFYSYTSAGPTGPFLNKAFVYRAPEPAAGKDYVYSPALHPQEPTSGDIVLSYNVNAWDFADSHADVMNYRPRFVDVTLPGLPNGPALPDAPTGLTAAPNQATSSVALTWTAPAGAGLTYQVYQRNKAMKETDYVRVNTAAVTGTSYTVGEIYSGDYEFRVAAVNAAGEGPRSDPAFATITIVAPATAPTGLTATANNDGTVSLAWNAVPGNGLIGYDIFLQDTSVKDPGYTQTYDAKVSWTTAVVRGLWAGHTYNFKVRARNSAGTGPLSDPAQATAYLPPPAAPTGLTGVSKPDGGISLSWSMPAPGWTWLYTSVDGGGFTQSLYPIGGATTFDIPANYVQAGHTYAYYVKAIGASSTVSDKSNTATVVSKVSPPTNLTASSNSDGSITLSWTAPFPGAWTGLYTSTDGINFTPPKYPIGGATTFTIPIAYLQNGQNYTYRVTALSGAGESAPSTPVSITVTVPPPAAPTNLTAVSGLDGSISLTWSMPAPGWTWLYTSVDGGGFTQAGLPIGGATSLLIPANYVQAGHTYAYYLRAIGAGNTLSDKSNTGTVVSTVAPPTGLTANANSDGSISLSWTAAFPGAWTGLYTSTDGVNFTPPKYPIGGATTFDIPANYLVRNQRYWYYVTTISAAGESGRSNTAQAVSYVPPPAAPTNLAAVAKPDGSISLSWHMPVAGQWTWLYTSTDDGQNYTRSGYPIGGPTVFDIPANYLTAGQRYTYYVTAIGEGGAESGWSNVVQATSLIAPPTNLGAGSNPDGSITLSWSLPVSGGWTWLYIQDLTAGGGYGKPVLVNGATTFTDPANFLHAGDQYEFYVTAVGPGGSQSAGTPPVPAWSTVARPTMHGASVAPDGAISLSWSMAVAGEWSWLYSSTDGGKNYTRSGYPIGGATSWTIPAVYLHAGDNDWFFVTAVGAGGESAGSNPVQAIPTVAAPTNLKAYASNGGAISLSWTAPFPGAWTWLYTSIDGGANYTQSAYPIGGATSWVIPDVYLKVGNLYMYKVSAISPAGESVRSDSAEARPYIMAPTITYADRNGNSAVSLTWNGQNSDAWYFVYLRDVQKESTAHSWSGSWPMKAMSLYAYGLIEGDTYEFTVYQAGYNGGMSSQSNTVAVALPWPTSGTCGSANSSWVGGAAGRNSGPQQLWDISVSVCSQRTGGAMTVDEYWDSSGHHVYAGGFLYLLYDCTTDSFTQWKDSMVYGNNPTVTSGYKHNSVNVDPNHLYKWRAYGSGSYNLQGIRNAFFDPSFTAPSGIIPTDVYTACF